MSNEKLNKILNVTVKIVTWIVIAFTIFMMVFTVFTVATFDQNERSIFGYKFYIVQTDSMSRSEKNEHLDVHFNAGDIIVVKERKDNTKFETGDIISFLSDNSDSFGKTITHMIKDVRKTSDGTVIGYVTYGTNTGAVDEKLVDPDFVLGEYQGKLPVVGKFFAYVKSTRGYIICILIPFLLVILYNAINVIRLFRKYKGEQTAAINEEKAQLAKEREENARMMQELLALKAKLEAQQTPTGEGAAEVSSDPAPSADSTEEA